MKQFFILTMLLFWIVFPEMAAADRFYSDREKYQIAKSVLGTRKCMSGKEVLKGNQRRSARVIKTQIALKKRIGMVCNERNESDVLMVFCVTKHKFERYIHRKNPTFCVELEPFLRWGAAPVYIDWGW